MASTASSSVFSAFDMDGDGKVSASELRGCMAAALGEDVSDEEDAAILATADTDGDGLLDHDEFMRLSDHLQEPAEEEEERMRCLREAFEMYAAAEEETTVITPASLRRMLRRLSSQHQLLGMEDCRAMICRFDLNGDGVLSFDEFRVMILMA